MAERIRSFRRSPPGGRPVASAPIAKMSSVSERVVHLHVHSEYSLLDGANKIEARWPTCAQPSSGMPALGLTDHGVMNGAVEHYKACNAAGIKPILGLEAYLVDDRRAARPRPARRAQPPDPARGQRRGLPEFGEADLGRLPRGLRARQGERGHGAAGPPLRGRDRAHRLPAVALLPAPDRGAARRRPRPHRRPLGVFGADNLYFEIQVNGIAEQDRANEGIVRIARELGRPLVATGDVHYLRREDYDNHAALLCVQTKSTLEQPKLSLRHQRVLPQERRGDGARRSPRGRSRCRRRSRSPSAARSRSSSASCCCRGSRRPTARSRRDAAAARERGPAPPLRRPAPGRGGRAARLRARRDPRDGLRVLLPDRLGLRPLREGERDRGRPGTRLGGGVDRRLLRSTSPTSTRSPTTFCSSASSTRRESPCRTSTSTSRSAAASG